MPDPADRRDQRRLPLPGTVTGAIGFADNIRVLSLSSIGALIESAERLSPGQPCVLALRLAGAECQLPAHVVWSALHSCDDAPETAPEHYRSGLHFPDLPERVRAHIRHYLTTVSPQSDGGMEAKA